jgi:hypothetical protein
MQSVLQRRQAGNAKSSKRRKWFIVLATEEAINELVRRRR